MQNTGLNELREKYLSYFESKEHLRLPSFPLVPQNDPSILLINAGMTPLKPWFTGKEKPPRKRVTTCQKCIRTPDIENVGKTSRHGTFFEMLGNFSFGDYFKQDAIPWAWELFTKVLEIPEDLLYVSVYEDDDEAFEIWNNKVGLAKEKIFRLGKEDNFWEHGTGPCGPCSEIYFDRGVEKGCGKPGCTVGCDCDRYIEVWNLVFTQFDKQQDGSYLPLVSKNIDTGMGLERLACVMQGVDTIFEVDTIKSVLDHVCKIANIKYGTDNESDVSIRVITDHVRSISMMISDGVLPSNEGRGYVLRRLLRRAARHGKLLGIDKLFLADIADTVMDTSGKAYPHMEEKRDYITKVITIEEEKFYHTIDQGMQILTGYIDQTKKDSKGTLTGEMVFKLHDTYGFPVDLTREIAEESGLEIDEDGFKSEMKKQKEKAREAHRNKEGSAWEKDLFSGIDEATQFVGYEKNFSEAKIVLIACNDSIVNQAEEGDNIVLLLDKTPFYAESGGQVGDTGIIKNNECVITILGCNKTADGKYLHNGVITSGSIKTGDTVRAEIDVEKRLAIRRNHTVTHLLQKALKDILGEHVNQSGSLVNTERLRFDFTHFSAVTKEQLDNIQKQINNKILEDIEVVTKEMTLDEARKEGATALFGEKYGDVVRVISVGDYSMELCGGTHLHSTGQAGLVKILGESGIAAGVRRIEALTGKVAFDYFSERETLIQDVANIVKSTPEESIKKIESMNEELKAQRKEIEQLRNKLVSSSLDDVINDALIINGSKIITARLDQMDMNGLRNTADTLKNKVSSALIALASGKDDKVQLVVTASKDLVQKGIHSGNIIRDIAQVTGGGGGGRPDMAQAGGKDVNKIDEALKLAVKLSKEKLES